CAPPARSADQVWPERVAAAFAAAGRGELRDVFQRDFDAWRGERALACMAQKPAALQCLDGVIERFDAIRGGLEHVTGSVPPDAVLSFLVDPQVCTHLAEPPRLVVRATPDTVAAFALAIEGA